LIIALYRQLEAVIQSMGPVVVVPEKTRVAFQVRMSYAAVMLKHKQYSPSDSDKVLYPFFSFIHWCCFPFLTG
jgi:hypothetical protein